MWEEKDTSCICDALNCAKNQSAVCRWRYTLAQHPHAACAPHNTPSCNKNQQTFHSLVTSLSFFEKLLSHPLSNHGSVDSSRSHKLELSLPPTPNCTRLCLIYRPGKSRPAWSSWWSLSVCIYSMLIKKRAQWNQEAFYVWEEYRLVFLVRERSKAFLLLPPKGHTVLV